jgi:hypothetical protein
MHHWHQSSLKMAQATIVILPSAVTQSLVRRQKAESISCADQQTKSSLRNLTSTAQMIAAVVMLINNNQGKQPSYNSKPDTYKREPDK